MNDSELGSSETMNETEASIQELKYAFAVVKEAQSLALSLEDSPSLLRAAKRMAEDPDFLKAAIRLAELESKVGKKYEELENSLSRLDADIREREKRLSVLEQNVDRLEERRRALLKEMDELERRRREQRARFEEESSSYRNQLRTMRARLERELRRQRVVRSEVEEFVKVKSEFKNSPDTRENLRKLLDQGNTLVEVKQKLQKEIERLEKKKDSLCQDIDLLTSMKRKAEESAQFTNRQETS